MRPVGGGSEGSPLRAHFVQEMFNPVFANAPGGGGVHDQYYWYPRRLTLDVTNDISTKIERVTHTIGSFNVGTPGSVVVPTDVTSIYVPGRVCDIRNANHDNNDNRAIDEFYVVASSSFAGGNTTITWEASSSGYRTGDIVADSNTNTLSSSLFKCLKTGRYRILMFANGWSINRTALRLANVSGFTYNSWSAATVDGPSVGAPGMAAYFQTQGFLVYDRIHTLNSGSYYEMQQWVGSAEANSGFGFPADNVPEPTYHCSLVIEEYVG